VVATETLFSNEIFFSFACVAAVEIFVLQLQAKLQPSFFQLQVSLQLDIFSCKYGCNRNILQLQLWLQPRMFSIDGVVTENFFGCKVSL
jgi:hypothetical protein